MTSQPTRLSPLPSQTQQNEPGLTGSNSTEDNIELQQLGFSIAIEDEADQDDGFQQATPRLSMPLEEREQTGKSIEIERHALHNQPPGRLSQGSFGTIRGSDRFDDLSALGLNDVSQPPLDQSVLQIVPDAEEDLGVFGRKSILGSVVI